MTSEGVMVPYATGTSAGHGGRPFAPLEYLEAARRRAKPMLIASLAVLAIAVLAAFLWPATYQSTGTILIEQQEVPEDFVRSAVSSYADQRVQVISQRVMTSSNLLGIIRKYSLYADEQSRVPSETLVERLRKDIELQMISADVVDPRLGRATKATIAFSVGFNSPSAELASKVANELTSLYLSENVQSRQQLAEGTAAFLTDQAQQLGKRVSELESQLATFKEANSDSLPELAQINTQLVGRNEEQLREIDSRIRLLDQQVVFLDAQIAQLSPSSLYITQGGERVLSPADRLKIARTEYATAASLYSESHPTVRRLKREVEGLEQQVHGVSPSGDVSRALTAAQGELASLRERYSAEHPDVIAAQRRVTALEGEVRRASSSRTSPRTNDEAADNPAYIQLRAQRQAASNERASLTAEKTQVRQRMQELESRLARSPSVERDFNALSRELESEKSRYSEVRQKQMEAQLAANMETERKGERFTLIEPPRTPQEPVSPNRRAVLALGIVLSLGAAFAILMLLEKLDTRIRGRRGIMSLLSVPPLAVIAWVESTEERLLRRRRLRHAAVGISGGVLAMLILAALVYFPVGALWARAVGHLG